MTDSRKSAPRIIYNDDGSNFLYAWDDLGAEDLKTYLSRLKGSQIDLVATCVAFGGFVTYYESEIAEAVGTGFALTDRVKQRRWVHNRNRLRDEVGDYIGFFFETLRELGIPAVASFRMNDAHMSSDPVGPVAGRFWMNHPEWRLGEPYGYYASCLDYAVPAVREYLRRLILEVLEKLPQIVGVELDAMRSPYFFKDGVGPANAPIMTGLVRQVRADLDAHSQATGHARHQLRVNVPRSPEAALEAGLDVAAWVQEGLVDGIAPGCYSAEYQLPIERWRELVGDDVQVHAYINCGAAMGQYLSLEEYRGAAANAWGAGADGVYLFNFPCFDELAFLTPVPVDRTPFPAPEFPAQGWHPDITRNFDALREIGDPERLAALDKRFLFAMSSTGYRHYPQELATIDRLVSEPAEMTWRCYEDYDSATTLRLEVKTVATTIRDRFTFEINGVPVSEGQITRLHASNGRDTRIHAIPLEPYSVYTIELDAATLKRGENALTVTLSERDADLFGEIHIRELVVSVGYAQE